MALLPQPLQGTIGEMLERTYEVSPTEAIALLLEAWAKLPEPKFNFDDSYHIAKRLIKNYMKERNHSEAKKWSEALYFCDTERIDSGEREFFSGMIAYETGDLGKAKEYFLTANEKSRGRCFIDEERKYKNLIK